MDGTVEDILKRTLRNGIDTTSVKILTRSDILGVSKLHKGIALGKVRRASVAWLTALIVLPSPTFSP